MGTIHLLMFAAACAVVALGAAYAHFRLRRFHAVRTTLVCPETGAPVDVLSVHDARRGRHLRVLECSRWDAGGDRRCDRRCLRP